MRRSVLAIVALVVMTSAAIAHHGWGNYNAANPVTVKGPILSSVFSNPHATITVQDSDKIWTLTLAPTSRMISRGALAELVAVGKQVVAFGYPSTAEKDEMRAERITIDGKTVELR